MGNVIGGLVLTFMTLISEICACLLSLIIFIIIIIHLFYNQTKKEEKITLILSANILIFIFVFGVLVISFCCNTILGDLYGYDFQSSWCIFSGYFVVVTIFALYSVFVSQAIFRLCRIVYSSYQWLQVFWLYIIAGPVELILGCAILSPVLIWNDVKYLPTEHYCFVSFVNLRGTVWTAVNAYAFPLLSLFCISLRITIFIHHQSNNATAVIQRRQQRDLLAIRRIIIIVSILLITGTPTVLLLIMALIRGVEYPLTYRILWFMTSIPMAGLSIIMVVLTPQLKRIVMKRWRRNRVADITNNERNVVPMIDIATG